MATQLPAEAAERLGPYYVYVLIDPTDDTIFYVGKGSRQRLLAHGREADLTVDERPRSAKVRRIRQIRQAGGEPRIDVIRHGLDEGAALLVEAALIDTLEGLTNAVDGHGAERGRKPLSEYVAEYGAPPVAADAPPVVLIRLSRWRDMDEEIEPGVWRRGNGYYPDMHLDELVDATRAWWKISPRSVHQRQIRHAVAVHNGVTRAIMQIGGWTRRDDGRQAFAATAVLKGAEFDAWVGPVGRRVPFTTASQNPIVYWPLNSS